MHDNICHAEQKQYRAYEEEVKQLDCASDESVVVLASVASKLSDILYYLGIAERLYYSWVLPDA